MNNLNDMNEIIGIEFYQDYDLDDQTTRYVMGIRPKTWKHLCRKYPELQFLSHENAQYEYTPDNQGDPFEAQDECYAFLSGLLFEWMDCIGIPEHCLRYPQDGFSDASLLHARWGCLDDYGSLLESYTPVHEVFDYPQSGDHYNYYELPDGPLCLYTGKIPQVARLGQPVTLEWVLLQQLYSSFSGHPHSSASAAR